MSIFDFLKATSFKKEIARLKAQNNDLQKIADLKLQAQQMAPAELQALINQKNMALETIDRKLEADKVVSK